MAQVRQDQQDEQLVVFVLADEFYALDIAMVKEIIAWEPVTRVPRAEGFVEGLINLRGNVIPVVDLRKRFGLPQAEVGRETRGVVVEIGNLVVGLVVDGVTEVLRVPHTQVETSAMVSGVETDFVRGVAKTEKGLILLLDADRMLTESEQGALEAGAATAKAVTDGAAVGSQ